MSENLERLCNISIDLDNPVQSAAGFDCLLLVGDAPAAPAVDAVPPVGVYSNLDEVTDIGWVAAGEGSEPIGRAARIAFSQNPHPQKIYIAVRQKLQGPEVEGQKEAITVTMDRAMETLGWYVICPMGVEPEQLTALAEWTEAHNKLMAFTTMETTNPVGVLKYRSIGVYAKPTESTKEPPADNECAAVAMVAKCLCYPAGTETWANMTVNGITPSLIPSTLRDTLDKQNLCSIIQVANKIITQGAKVAAGEWIDVIRFRDWLQNDMQARICNLLILNPKIPYTDSGITAVENQMIASLKEGQTRGGIAEKEFDELEQEVPGYKTQMPLASSLTAGQRASRELKGCKFSARIAGAIHMVEISGSLTYKF